MRHGKHLIHISMRDELQDLGSMRNHRIYQKCFCSFITKIIGRNFKIMRRKQDKCLSMLPLVPMAHLCIGTFFFRLSLLFFPLLKLLQTIAMK